jgi:hypothetical protein
MQKSDGSINRPVNRRSFLKTGMLAGSAATVGAGLVGSLKPAFGQSSSLTKGDVAILRMLAAAELIEADLWTQYAELGGIGDNPPIEVAPPQPTVGQLSGCPLDPRYRWPAIHHQQYP